MPPPPCPGAPRIPHRCETASPQGPHDAPQATITAAPQTCACTFQATADQVREARRYLAALLADSPETADTLACLSELATNAIEHSNSARPGGRFTVRASRHTGFLRVEVEDDGGPWQEPGGHDSQRGRGLLIVAALAHAWGVIDGPAGRRVVWFETGCP